MCIIELKEILPIFSLVDSINLSSPSKWEPKIDFSKGIESPIEILDDDVFFIILSYLSFADRIKIERVSHKWQQMSQMSWYQVDKFDFSVNTWRIRPIHFVCDCDIDSSSHGFIVYEPCPKIFCSNVIKKILTLSANTLTYCDFSQTDYDDPSISLSEKTISEFLKSCRNLKFLRINECNWFDFPRKSLDNLKTEKLEEFDYTADYGEGNDEEIYSEEMEVVAYFRKILKNSPRLHTIEMCAVQIDIEELEMIVNKDAFKSLILVGAPPIDAEKIILKFKNLENFRVYNLENMTDSVSKILIDKCKKLKSICLLRSLITDKGLLNLKSLPNLEHLELIGCRNISDINFHYFSNLKSLKCIFTPSVEDKGIIELLKSSQKLLWKLNFMV